MEFLGDVVAWFLDPENWTGATGIPNRVWEHVQISVMATVAAAAVALPPALWLGHKRRGGFLAVATVNIGRAVPSFAIMALFLPISIRLGLGLGFWPTMLALFALALPPIFTNTYTAVRDVDPALVEAGRGMGMTDGEVLRGIEAPMASPVILAAIRISAVQVVATAPLAALVAWGGLGRYIVDGFAVQDNVRVLAGGILVAGLSVATELLLGAIEKRVVPKGLGRATEELAQPAHG
ncbi:MAG: ABC transporter permease [Acidimicrobiia bacterium]|nr:ABC transporter permease [Acidimicrobiia bacterium]